MNKMRALIDFESMDGSFKAGDTFHVNDERARALTRTERAERAPADEQDAAVTDAQAAGGEQSESTEAAADGTPVALGVPKRQPE